MMKSLFTLLLPFVALDAQAVDNKLSASVKKIFETKCVSCHSSGGSAQAIFGDIMSIDDLLKHKIIDPANPEESKLVQSLTSKNMPLGGAPLSSKEIQEIRAWMKSV